MTIDKSEVFRPTPPVWAVTVVKHVHSNFHTNFGPQPARTVTAITAKKQPIVCKHCSYVAARCRRVENSCGRSPPQIRYNKKQVRRQRQSSMRSYCTPIRMPRTSIIAVDRPAASSLVPLDLRHSSRRPSIPAAACAPTPSWPQRKPPPKQTLERGVNR